MTWTLAWWWSRQNKYRKTQSRGGLCLPTWNGFFFLSFFLHYVNFRVIFGSFGHLPSPSLVCLVANTPITLKSESRIWRRAAASSNTLSFKNMRGNLVGKEGEEGNVSLAGEKMKIKESETRNWWEWEMVFCFTEMNRIRNAFSFISNS